VTTEFLHGLQVHVYVCTCLMIVHFAVSPRVLNIHFISIWRCTFCENSRAKWLMLLVH